MNVPWNAKKPNHWKAFVTAMKRTELQFLEIFKDEVEQLVFPQRITEVSFENETTVVETSRPLKSTILLICNFSKLKILQYVDSHENVHPKVSEL